MKPGKQTQRHIYERICLLSIDTQLSGGCAAAVSGERVHKVIPLDAVHIIEGEPADAMDVE